MTFRPISEAPPGWHIIGCEVFGGGVFSVGETWQVDGKWVYYGPAVGKLCEWSPQLWCEMPHPDGELFDEIAASKS
jgi:hypothetical protein